MAMSRKKSQIAGSRGRATAKKLGTGSPEGAQSGKALRPFRPLEGGIVEKSPPAVGEGRRPPRKTADNGIAAAAIQPCRISAKGRAGNPTAWPLVDAALLSFLSLFPDPLFLHQDGKFLFVNAPGVRLFGAKKSGEIIGRQVLDLVHKDFREFVRERIRTSYEDQVPMPLRDAVILSVEGTPIDIEATTTPVVAGGRPATLVIMRDITERKKASAALQESEQQLRSLFDAPNIVLGILEDLGDDIMVVRANGTLAALYGASPEGLSGKRTTEFNVPQEVVRDQLARYRQARESQSPVTWEYRRTWTGREQWFASTVSHIGAGPEGRDRYRFMAQDITERKNIEQRLRDQMELIDLASDAIIIRQFATDTITYWNKGAEDMYGWPSEEALGKSTHVLLATRFPTPIAQIRNQLLEHGSWEGELYHTRRDEKIICVLSRWTLHMQDGLPERYIEINTDITERKRTAEALQENQERLSALNANLSGSMVYQINSGPDGRQRQFTYVSPAVELFHGLTAEAVRQDPRLLYEQVIGQDRERVAELEERAFADRTKMEADVRVRMPSGEVRWRRFVSSPRKAPDGSWLWDGIEVDITELKAAESELRESQRRYALLFGKSTVATSLSALPGNVIVDANDAYEELFGYTRREIVGKTPEELGISRAGDDRATIAQIERHGYQHNVEKRIFTKDGDELTVVVNNTVMEFSGNRYLLSTMQDITERKRAADIDETRLRLLERSANCSLDELLIATLDEAETLTGSRVGFFHFLERDQETLTLQAWSTRTTREMCKAEGKGRHYAVSDAGVWADCIRERRPVIHNDYASLPHRKGLPPGHAAVLRELVVPVMRGERIVAMLGVGNKEADYRPSDVEIVARLADIAWDITERLRIEEALDGYRRDLELRVEQRTEQLQEAHARLLSILESISDGFFVMDADWRFVYVNAEATRIWRIPSENLIGRTCWEVSPSSVGTVFEEQYRRAMQDRVPVVFEAVSTITGRWVEVRAHPSDGGLSVYFHDITARREQDAERTRLASAVEAAAEGVMITDRNGIIQYVNPAFEQITGYAREEADGRPIHFLDSGRQNKDFFRAVRESLKSTGVWRGQMISRKKHGTLFFENCIISSVKNEAGEIVNYVSIMRDETEQLRLESIAAAMNSMDNLGYVFAGVRHEIGNPVNNAKMALSVLLHQLDDASRETIEGYAKRALTELGRVERLLRSLKTFNIHEALHVAEIELAPVLQEVLSLIRPDLERRAISVVSDIGAGADRCHADPRALLQVLLNLVTNAVDALEGCEGGRILLETLREGSIVHVRVRDNGRGIAKEQLQQLFRPFFTSKLNGTGLGLVIVRKMLAQMGAGIEITSAYGEGTVADVSLRRGGNHADTAPQDTAGHR